MKTKKCITANNFRDMTIRDRDWECLDCGIIYCADKDATRRDLPEFCIECGDHQGWQNVETGRTIP